MKMHPQVSPPPTIKTLADIKKVISEFDPARHQVTANVPLNATISVPEDTSTKDYRLSTTTRSKSRRDLLLEGLEIVKRRMDASSNMQPGEPIEVGNRLMSPARIGNSSDGVMWVDPLIREWFGARREGIHICWNLEGYIYKYDPFAHKLTRVPSSPG